MLVSNDVFSVRRVAPRLLLLWLAVNLGACDQKNKASSAGDQGEGLAVAVPDSEDKTRKVHREVFDAVHAYLQTQTNSFTLKLSPQAGGASAARNGTAYTMYAVSTYAAEKGELFYKLADTYDNALAAIFWTEFNHPVPAMQVLDTYVRLMGLRGYAPQAQGLTKGFRGLPARYSFNAGKHLVPPREPADSWAIDTGNNAFMGLAFCKFHRKFLSENIRHDTYLNAAFSILSFLTDERRCAQGVGIRGRAATGPDDSWVSTEHNLDVYALSQCLQGLSTTPARAAILEKSRLAAEAFLDKVYDEAQGIYRTGTPNCEGTPDPSAPIAADAQSWRYLAQGGVGPLHARSKSSLAALLSDSFYTPDSRDLPNGCEAAAIDGVDETMPCAAVQAERLWFGTRFSNQGFGIQFENTGAAFLALSHFANHNADSGFASERLEGLQKTLREVLAEAGNQGVPASLRTHPLKRRLANGQLANVYNTGLQWDYFKKPHTASTVWTALALAYKPADKADEGFNPYAAVSSSLNDPPLSPLTQFMQESSVASLSCAEAKSLPVRAVACPGSNDHTATLCSNYCGAATPDWFDAAIATDRFLVSLGVDSSNLCELCNHTQLQACEADELHHILRYVWTHYTKACRQS